MTAAVIAFTRQGAALGQKIADHLGGTLHVSDRIAEDLHLPASGSLKDWTGEHFHSADALIFVGACGIAVRAIAPYVKDKFTDPAVLSVDELGRFVVPLLSGHVGGGNELAQRVAALTGGIPVISTATDVNGRWAVDVWAKKEGLLITNRTLAKEISAALLENRPVGALSDFPLVGTLPKGLRKERQEINFRVTVSDTVEENTLALVPRILVLGIGCRRGTAAEQIEAAVRKATEGLDPRAFLAVGSIDVKADEPGLLEWCEEHQLPFKTFSAEKLQSLPGTFTPSKFVAATVGVDNVCERSAAALGGMILRPKMARDGVTVAVGQLPFTIFL